jgi:hypothetical protein
MGAIGFNKAGTTRLPAAHVRAAMLLELIHANDPDRRLDLLASRPPRSRPPGEGWVHRGYVTARMAKLVPWAHRKTRYSMGKNAILGLEAAGLIEVVYKEWKNGARRATWVRLLPGACVKVPEKGWRRRVCLTCALARPTGRCACCGGAIR